MESSEVSCEKFHPVVGYARLSHVAMPVGAPGNEQLVLNVDSLWSGGPFETEVGRGDLQPSVKGLNASSGLYWGQSIQRYIWCSA